MKTKITALAMFFCQLLSAQAANHEEELKSVINEFIEATDVQDAERLAATLHEQAMQYVKFGPRLLTFSKEEYVAQLQAKKVGGIPRSIIYGKLIKPGKDVATWALVAKSSKLKFLYQISLVRMESGWQITSINTEVERL